METSTPSSSNLADQLTREPFDFDTITKEDMNQTKDRKIINECIQKYV